MKFHYGEGRKENPLRLFEKEKYFGFAIALRILPPRRVAALGCTHTSVRACERVCVTEREGGGVRNCLVLKNGRIVHSVT